MRNQHPVFGEQIDPETPLWRYFDFAKFTSLLLNRALYFCRADMLGDPLEGSATRARIAERQRLLQNPPDGKTREDLEDVFRHNAGIFRRERRCAYVNCWHAGDHESMAMWQGYGGGGYGVAIQSTFALLANVLPAHFQLRDREEPVFIGRVRYVDHSSEAETVPNEYNLYGMFMGKSVAYRHESEVRAIFADLVGGWSGTSSAGHLVPVDVQRMVRSVTVSPLAPAWFEELVLATCSHLGFDLPLRKSIATMEPIY